MRRRRRRLDSRPQIYSTSRFSGWIKRFCVLPPGFEGPTDDSLCFADGPSLWIGLMNENKLNGITFRNSRLCSTVLAADDLHSLAAELN